VKCCRFTNRKPPSAQYSKKFTRVEPANCNAARFSRVRIGSGVILLLGVAFEAFWLHFDLYFPPSLYLRCTLFYSPSKLGLGDEVLSRVAYVYSSPETVL